MSDAKKTRLVRCTVCECLVVKTALVPTYAHPVCVDCDRDMQARDEELWERDQAEEYERLWKRL